MMLKVLVYAYCKKIYTSRKIAEALEENIHFMWLSGEQTPDFRTLNDFRGKRMKGVIVVSVLMFQKNAWSVHPEDMVTELLQQVHGMK